jgi:hypothetical protein
MVEKAYTGFDLAAAISIQVNFYNNIGFIGAPYYLPTPSRIYFHSQSP